MNQDNQKSTASIVPSQLKIIRTLPEELQLKVYDALFDYEFYSKEFDETLLENKVVEALWIMSKPLIDKRIVWAKNGQNGGLARGKNSKSIANKKQTNSKLKANQKQTDTKPIGDMDKDMDKERKYPYPSGGSLKVPPVGTEISEIDKVCPIQDEDWDWDWDKVPDPVPLPKKEDDS